MIRRNSARRFIKNAFYPPVETESLLQRRIDAYFDEAFMSPRIEQQSEFIELDDSNADDYGHPGILFLHKGKYYPLVHFLEGEPLYHHLGEDHEGFGAKYAYLEIVPGEKYIPLLETEEGVEFFCNFILIEMEDD